MPNKKQKITHKSLLTATELPKYGNELPVHQLPDVQRAAKAEYRKGRPHLVKRLSKAAVDAHAMLMLKASRINVEVKRNSAEETYLEPKNGVVNLLGHLAISSLNKSLRRKASDNQKWRIAHEKAAIQYREQHPEIAEHEAKLHSEQQKQQEEQRKRSLPNEVFKRGKYAIDYFSAKNVSSFSKAIPRRPQAEGRPGFSGDYAELAKQTITSALTRKAEDGTVPLLGLKLERARLDDRYEQGQSLITARKAESEYIDGVSTALWQLGFVQYNDERSIAYGNGSFNPAIEWERTHDIVTARIPFDADNELHQMLAPDRNSASASQMIELEMSAPDYGGYGSPQPPFMNMRLAEIAPLAMAA